MGLFSDPVYADDVSRFDVGTFLRGFSVDEDESLLTQPPDIGARLVWKKS